MARRSMALLAVLSLISAFVATAAQAQNPADLMNKAGALGKMAGPLDLNSASLDDLKKLPGLGDADATKIVSARPFGSTSELVDKDIISQAVFDKIKSFITVK